MLAFRQLPRPRQCTLQCARKAMCFRREIHLSRCFAEEKKSFRGQLYESTAQRLERERADQRRFAHERGSNRGGRNAAITFGQTPFFLRSSSTDAM